MAFPFVRQMGSESKYHKRHYDISMSKRTRKPAKIQDEIQNLAPNNDDDNGDRFESPATEGFENDDHKSLKQLMINGEKGKAETRSGADESGRGRNSLGQHFSKEEMNNNNLQLVKKQHQDGLQGVKLKKVIGNFLKNLIKGDQHQLKKTRKKPFL